MSDDAVTSFRCTYCGQRNALTEGRPIEAAKCGRCRLPASSVPHRKFAELDPNDYIHPLDSQALGALRSIPGVDTVLKKLIELTGESYMRVMANANTVKVGPTQYADLDAKLDIVCCTLGVPKPDLYVTVSDPIFGTGVGFNAMTTGVEKPFIIGFSTLLERLDDREILAVLAHEVGHIHAQHMLYTTAARLLAVITEFLLAANPITATLGTIVNMTIRVALINWYQKAELSCDRAALLVVQDKDVMVSAMLKLAGGLMAGRSVNQEAFIEQARDFDRQYEERMVDKFWTIIAASGRTHPFPVWRVAEILKWVDAGDYERVMTRADG
ncbi:MAG: M48 family metallopeptidase [Blastocatellia bacterium]|nr:M48 family metallopeptidase [Blastocatellia bacterium]